MDPRGKKLQCGAVYTLPTDILAEILSYLPATILLRFRVVSRLFQSLLSSPEFALLHASRAIRDSSVAQFFLCPSDSPSYLLLRPHPHLRIPSPHRLSPLLASSHGLVLSFDPSGTAVALNPLTGFSLHLPPAPPASQLLGFGLSSSSPPFFKAVVASRRRVSVCTIRRAPRSWRRAPGEFPRLFWYQHRRNLGIYHGGALYWSNYARSRPSGRPLLLSFNLARETFRSVLGPQLDPDAQFGRSFLVAMGPDLGFVINVLHGRGTEVWRLVDAEDELWRKEEGVVGVLAELGMDYCDEDPHKRDMVYYNCLVRRFEFLPPAVIENIGEENVRGKFALFTGTLMSPLSQ